MELNKLSDRLYRSYDTICVKLKIPCTICKGKTGLFGDNGLYILDDKSYEIEQSLCSMTCVNEFVRINFPFDNAKPYNGSTDKKTFPFKCKEVATDTNEIKDYFIQEKELLEGFGTNKGCYMSEFEYATKKYLKNQDYLNAIEWLKKPLLPKKWEKRTDFVANGTFSRLTKVRLNCYIQIITCLVFLYDKIDDGLTKEQMNELQKYVMGYKELLVTHNTISLKKIQIPSSMAVILLRVHAFIFERGATCKHYTAIFNKLGIKTNKIQSGQMVFDIFREYSTKKDDPKYYSMLAEYVKLLSLNESIMMNMFVGVYRHDNFKSNDYYAEQFKKELKEHEQNNKQKKNVFK